MSPQNQIFSTICYFDIFNFPLSREEVFQYLWKGNGNPENTVDAALEELVKAGRLQKKNGYYFLPGREEIVNGRMRSVVPTENKLKRARLAVKFISWIPFLRAVYVCNSVAAETAKEGSDIDLFIVTAEGRLWMVRFITNVVLKMFGLRTGRQSANKICLSFYVGEKHLDLGPWRVSEEDIYLAYWLMQLLPVRDPDNILEKIYRSNLWTKDLVKLIPSLPPEKNKPMFKGFLEFLLKGQAGNAFESISKKIQWRFLRQGIKIQATRRDGTVVVEDGVLKLHEHDARREFLQEWKKNNMSYVA